MVDVTTIRFDPKEVSTVEIPDNADGLIVGTKYGDGPQVMGTFDADASPSFTEYAVSVVGVGDGDTFGNAAHVLPWTNPNGGSYVVVLE